METDKVLELYHDLTFEWVAAFLSEIFNIPVKSINALPIGIFSRYVRRDIEEIKLAKVDGTDNIFFRLNREGFYDALPEYLFHQSRDHKFFSTSGESILSEIEKGREIEESVRKFFQIFEEELLRSNIRIQQYENGVRKVDFGILRNRLVEWLIPFTVDEFTDQEITKILIFLPYVYQRTNVQDLEVYEELLDYFFDIESVVSYFSEEVFLDIDKITEGLGSQNLSWNFCLSGDMVEFQNVLQLVIFPKSEQDFMAFIIDDNLLLKIRKIFEWILPYNVELRIKKELVPGGIKGISLGLGHSNYLGYARA